MCTSVERRLKRALGHKFLHVVLHLLSPACALRCSFLMTLSDNELDGPKAPLRAGSTASVRMPMLKRKDERSQHV